MANLRSLFRSSGQAAIYSKYRFTTPSCIASRVLQYTEAAHGCNPFKHALDIGCGNGQSTEYLARNFEQVTGIDISDTQIEEAQRRNTYRNITYKVGTATKIPIANDQLQLITASQCHHWLELPKFYTEVRRTLVSKGVICIFWYMLPEIVGGEQEKHANRLLRYIYDVETDNYSDERRQIIDKGFTDLHFPFDSIVKENLASEMETTVSDVRGYIESWSAYQAMKMAEPKRADKLLSDFKQDLVKIFVSEETDPDKIQLQLKIPYYLIMGQKI